MTEPLSEGFFKEAYSQLVASLVRKAGGGALSHYRRCGTAKLFKGLAALARATARKAYGLVVSSGAQSVN